MDFPFIPVSLSLTLDTSNESIHFDSIMESVIQIKGYPRVVLSTNNSPTILDSNGSLFDGGANIAMTNDLSLLVDVKSIHPFSVGVAVKNPNDLSTTHPTCKKRGLLPIPMLYGTIHYQPCFYNKHASETIISPQAIIASSEILEEWVQVGRK